jgi:hypothetical protein
VILKDDLCIQSFDPRGQAQVDGRKQLTEGGDCGTIFLDEYAKPWGMHQVLYYQGESREFTSCCVPLHKILDSEHHRDFFPHNDSVIHWSSPLVRRSSSAKENGESVVCNYTILDKPLLFNCKTKEISPYHQGIVVIHQPKIFTTKTVPLTPFRGYPFPGQQGYVRTHTTKRSYKLCL